MTNPLLRPRWLVGHALAVVGIVSFVLLGMWQLRRHDEKVALRAAVEAAIESDPVAIGAASVGGFSRVTVVGSFDPTLQQRVPRSRDGVSGYEVVVPLVLDSGGAVLVDRGWVGIDESPGAPPDRITGTGVLWPGESGPLPEAFSEYTPRIDPAAVATAAGYQIRPEYLVLTEQDPPFSIEPPEIGGVSLGPHLGYAGQWFFFAAVVTVGYPLLLRRRAGGSVNRG